MKHFTRSFLIIMMLVGLCSAVPVSKGGSFALPNQTAYTPLLSFFEKCCDGEWTSGSPRTKPEVLPCPGSDADDRGFVRPLGVNFVLENDNPGTRSIQTHPKWVTSGYIQGVFPLADFGIKLQSGDRFSSKVGFLKGAGQGEVKFTVLYDSKPNQSGGEVKLAEIVHPYTGKLETIQVSLAQFSGGQGAIILRVDALQSSAQDWAVWVDPRLERKPAPTATATAVPSATPTAPPSPSPTLAPTMTSTAPPAPPPIPGPSLDPAVLEEGFAWITEGPVFMEGIADGDGDGVLNLFDQCRYTPEELKDRVFEDGCLCHDSDGGFNYLREGTVTYRLIDGEDTNTDHCADGTLVEYACDPNYEYRESDPVRSREVECTALGSNYQCRRNRCIPVVEAIPYLCWSSEGTCADGIQNQGEEGVDCGGICPPCNTHCTSGTRYAPPDTPCTTHYPDDPYRIDLPWTDNELEYTCQFHEVCHPELDHIIEEALRCCSIPTTRTGVTDEESERLYFEATSSLPDPVLCRVARGMAEGRGGGCQNCVGFYILKGLGIFSRWMVGYTWLYPDHNVYENVSQLPAEQLVNDYQTGICRDYAEVVPTLLRKAGFAQEDVGGRCDGNHCYNAVRLPGDRAWHVVDTTGNQLGIVLGGLPGYGAYPYCSRFNEANWCWGDSRSNGDPCTGTELYERDHASNCEPGFTCNRDLHSIPGWAPPYSEIIDCGY